MRLKCRQNLLQETQLEEWSAGTKRVMANHVCQKDYHRALYSQDMDRFAKQYLHQAVSAKCNDLLSVHSQLGLLVADFASPKLGQQSRQPRCPDSDSPCRVTDKALSVLAQMVQGHA